MQHRRAEGVHAQYTILRIYICAVLLLFAHLPGSSQSKGKLFSSQLKQTKQRGITVPLDIRVGVHRVRGRSLLRSGSTRVWGAIREGYFYAHLKLGTPTRQFSTIIDTGSTITYIPCSNCKHCGIHMDPGFNPEKSSTAKLLGCQDQLCNCGTPSCSCQENKCYYTRHYAEMSSSEGWLVADKLQFPDNGTSLEFVFGCENQETGAIYQQKVDGVLGMGNNKNSFPRQLARSGHVDDVFSLCFGFPAGGAMLLGDVPLSSGTKFQYTPLVDRGLHYYNVDLHTMTLNGETVAATQADYTRGYGAVMDSGTTFTYLPTPAFKSFVAIVEQAVSDKGLHKMRGNDSEYDDICWRGAPPDFKGINDIFPSGTIGFGGGAQFVLTPERYLFIAGHGEYCLGVFDNGRQGTLIGGIIVRNVLVQYDSKNQRVGFAETDCTNLVTPAQQGQPTAAASLAQADNNGLAAAPAAAVSSSAITTQQTIVQSAQQHEPAQVQQQQRLATQESSQADKQLRQQSQLSTNISGTSITQRPHFTAATNSQSYNGLQSRQTSILVFIVVACLLVGAVLQLSYATIHRHQHRSGTNSNTAAAISAGHTCYAQVDATDADDIQTELTHLSGKAATAVTAV